MAIAPNGALTDAQKARMLKVVKAWERSGFGTKVLEDGLRILSDENRPRSDTVLRKNPAEAVVVCGYGSGARSKHTLERDEAAFLLRVVLPIRSRTLVEESARSLVQKASAVLLEGQQIPKTIADPSWEPLIKILADVAPCLNQSTMFGDAPKPAKQGGLF